MILYKCEECLRSLIQSEQDACGRKLLCPNMGCKMYSKIQEGVKKESDFFGVRIGSASGRWSEQMGSFHYVDPLELEATPRGFGSPWQGLHRITGEQSNEEVQTVASGVSEVRPGIASDQISCGSVAQINPMDEVPTQYNYRPYLQSGGSGGV